MMVPFVDLKAQYALIKEEIDKAVMEVIHQTAFIGGTFVEKFETEFAKFCGVKYCIGVGNGTDALFIALKVLNIGSGDEVITAANSFIATSEAITMSGARVVFVDIDPKTYNIDTTQIEEKITAKTKAIIPVHLYGQPADLNPIIDLAKKYNLYVIEDAAQAHGAIYKWRFTGSIGDIGCFSFYPGKNLGAYGDGGAIVTNDEKIANKARMFANHGRKEKYDHQFEGVNSRLDGLQAAILSVKLKYLTQWNEKRRLNAHLYQKNLESVTEIILPSESDDVKSVYHLYVIRTDRSKRDQLQNFLKKNDIMTGIHYPIALPDLEAYHYLNHTESDFPVASNYAKQILSLPMFPELSEAQIVYTSTMIKQFFKRMP